MPEKVKVARLADVPDGAGVQVQANGQPIALFKVAGKVHAIHNTCPHRGGPLAEGWLDGNRVACPWHGWTFDVTSGALAMNPAMKQACFEVAVEGDDVYVMI